MVFMNPDSYIDYLSLIHRNIYKTHFNAANLRVIRNYLRLIEEELLRQDPNNHESDRSEV